MEEHTLITARNAKKLLMAGFTSAFSAASAKIRLEVAVRNAINTGVIDGPRLLAASPEFTATGGLGYGVVRIINYFELTAVRSVAYMNPIVSDTQLMAPKKSVKL